MIALGTSMPRSGRKQLNLPETLQVLASAPSEIGLPPKLVSPNGLLCLPKYAIWKLPGSIPHVWLQQEVVARLLRVDHCIRARTKGQGALLIWDGLRSMRTQTHLYQTERARIDQLHQDKEPEQREAILNDIIRPPLLDKPPPHTTGGAVDCTIWFGDGDHALGTFDDFTDRGRSNYFFSKRITNIPDLVMAARRIMLRDEMQAEGFVGIESEWWHWEFGTRLWAERKKTTPLYDTVLIAPDTDSPALRHSRTPSRYPEHVLGIGQVFATPDERAQALRKENKGHYYARTRHPNERRVAEQLGAMVGATDAVLMPSGLSAALMAVWAHTPYRGKVLLDSFTYYETVNSIRQIAENLRWQVILTDLADTHEIVKHGFSPVDVIFVDHPRNWMLTCPHLAELRRLARRCGAKLIVDTSLQPLQRLFSLSLADLVTVSLSKYPSSGVTAGGAVFGTSALLQPVDDIRRTLGMLLAPDAAAKILEHLPSLQDRMSVISQKATRVVAMLKDLPFVRDVRIPSLDHVGAAAGGQITFLLDSETAIRAEQIIAANTLDPNFPFAFACTFGASFTTFEHFDSRNTDGMRTSVGSDHIEAGRIRIGIGNEDGDLIVENLRYVLLAAQCA